MRTFREWLRGDDVVPVLTDPKKDLSLSEAVQKHAKENNKPESRVVRVYRMLKGRQRQITLDVDVKWVYDNRASIESALRDLVGGGRFELQFTNDRGRETWRFDYDIAGPNRGLREDGNGDDAKPRSQRVDGSYQMMVTEKLLDANIAQKASSKDDFDKWIEMAKIMKGDGDDVGFLKEMAVNSYNNLISQKEMGFDNAMKMMEMIRTAQPTIEKEDPLVAIIQGLIPLVTQFIAAKQGLGPQLNPAQMQQMQQLQQQLPQHLGQQSPQLGQTVPVAAPGEPEQAPPTAPGAVPSAPLRLPTTSALDMMLKEFRDNVTADADPAHLAFDFSEMVQKATVMAARGDPHPVFAGLINQSDPARLSHEYDRFVAAIPEFRGKPESAAAIKAVLQAALVAKYTAGAQPEPEPEPAPEPQQPQAEPAGDTVGQENVANHVNIPGPTPSSDQPGSDTNGTDADQPDGQPVGGPASENDHAPTQVWPTR